MGIRKASCVLFAAAAVGFSSQATEAPLAAAQAFSSGSTGADGTLDLATNCSSPYSVDNSCYVQLPPNGVLNYTTVNIPSNKVLKFRKNVLNTPAILLAQGNVTVAGSIQVQAGDYAYPGINSLDNSLPGPGGFRGGVPGQPGLGPLGGQPTSLPDSHGRWLGPLSLVPIIGGSGGAGFTCTGGGGGGAVVIASSGSIDVSGTIYAYGTSFCSFTSSGSGGAIRLVANSVAVSGHLDASSPTGQALHYGVIRLEAAPGAVLVAGSTIPPAVISQINPTIVAPVTTSLTIVSVGGYAVPVYAGQRTDMVDVLLPSQLPDPINVVVAASNIPVGTAIDMKFGTSNAGTVTPGVLAGSTASSSATVSVSGLNRQQLAYLFVSATFTVLQGAAAGNPPGPNQVAQVQARAAPGGPTQFTFLRKDGSLISERDVPPRILSQFRR